MDEVKKTKKEGATTKEIDKPVRNIHNGKEVIDHIQLEFQPRTKKRRLSSLTFLMREKVNSFQTCPKEGTNAYLLLEFS